MKIADDWKDYEILDMAERRKIRTLGKYSINKTRSANHMERKNI